jgi:hypothetical protein
MVVTNNASREYGRQSTFEVHFLIGTATGVEHLVETHTLTLFSDDDYRAAFENAGLTVAVVPSPYPERDRYVGTLRRSQATRAATIGRKAAWETENRPMVIAAPRQGRAEGVGFEPTGLITQRFSRPSRSAAPASLRTARYLRGSTRSKPVYGRSTCGTTRPPSLSW